jgi:hypothetical protein
MNKYTTVDEFLSDQTPENLAQINHVRKLILRIEPTLVENLKWNAPNYVFQDEDRITFNLMNKEGCVKLILHMGASKKENKKAKPVLTNDHGIVVWNSDIRGTISFNSLDDVLNKEQALSDTITGWLSVKV